jgi:hypothetical protein
MEPSKENMHKEVEVRFTYHTPTEEQIQIMANMRDRCKLLAHFIVENSPVSREQSLALTALEDVCFNFNAGVVRRGAKLPEA